MPKYHLKESDGDDSGYESDGATEYKPAQKIGEGVYSVARTLLGKGSKNPLVVLSPNPFYTPDLYEVKTKYHFFKTLYPEKETHLFTYNTKNPDKKTYRLVLPMLPGIPYNNLEVNETETLTRLFLSAIKAVKACHEQGIVIVDLNRSNMLYDPDTETTWLIDGGYSAKMNEEPVYPKIFVLDSLQKVKLYPLKYPNIPPECWSTTQVLAQSSMDIYCLGYLINRFHPRDETIKTLCRACMSPVAKERPTMADLEKQLVHLLESCKESPGPGM